MHEVNADIMTIIDHHTCNSSGCQN